MNKPVTAHLQPHAITPEKRAAIRVVLPIDGIVLIVAGYAQPLWSGCFDVKIPLPKYVPKVLQGEDHQMDHPLPERSRQYPDMRRLMNSIERIADICWLKRYAAPWAWFKKADHDYKWWTTIVDDHTVGLEDKVANQNWHGTTYTKGRVLTPAQKAAREASLLRCREIGAKLKAGRAARQ